MDLRDAEVIDPAPDPESWWSWSSDGPEREEFFAEAEVITVEPRLNPAYTGQYEAGMSYTEQNDPRPAHYAPVVEMEPGIDYLMLLRARDAAGNESENFNLLKASLP